MTEESEKEPLDFSTNGVAEKLISKCYDHFCSPRALKDDIEKLMNVMSNNIPLLRKLVQQLKIRSGLEPIYQGHHHKINATTMAQFLRTAQDYLCETNAQHVQSEEMLCDVLEVGRRKLAHNLEVDVVQKRTSRYRWGHQPQVNVNDSVVIEQTQTL
ncbi:hypothetical protein DFH28DRAFT_931006 [Melampsora americana]|nr:hypothetical protein DFH28DRAFT_931006 [Melampsora americana]